VSLATADVAEFEQELRGIANDVESDDGAVGPAVTALLKELDDSELSVDEVTRRLARFVDVVATTSARLARLTSSVASSAATMRPEIRAAVVPALPPALRQAVYASSGGGRRATEIDADEAAAEPEAETTADVDRDTVDMETASDDGRTVFLLGTKQEIRTNETFLKKNNYAAVAVNRLDQFELLIDYESACGVVVHSGWWQLFSDSQARVEFVRNLITRSGVLQLRLHTEGLADAAGPVSKLIAEAGDQLSARVQVGAAPALTSMDLERLDRTARLLRSAASARLGLEGMDKADQRLLAIAVALFVSRGGSPPEDADDQLMVQPLDGGQSAAKVLRLTSSKHGSGFVAKIDEFDRLVQERDRARLTQLAPPIDIEVYALNDKAVLIQRLLHNLDDLSRGAPSLRERLEQCVAHERGNTGVPEPNRADLECGLDRLIQAIKQVNRPRGNTDPRSLGWMKVEPLAELAAREVKWTLESDEGEFDPSDHLEWVDEKLAERGDALLVHGDLHAGNVLLREDRVPEMIDFALAGAGHPCFDLVRVGSALSLAFIRPLVAESTIRQFFRRAHVDGASKTELMAEFPTLLSGVGPCVAVHALVSCRETALEQVGVDVDDAKEHYLAMVYLVAAQSLTMDQFEGAVVRGLLGAIQPSIKRFSGT
jgi:hypothetical protein